MTEPELSKFASLLMSVTEVDLAVDTTLGGRLLLGQSGEVTICYAPFEHVQRNARLVIVGITPGRQQALNALLEVRRQLIARASHETALSAAKVFASFSGPMRSNLVAMLDYIGLAQWLGLDSTAEVWNRRSDLAHFTSALRYPVYVKGKNYSGSPSMTATPILRELLCRCLGEEVELLHNAVWVPLGPKATEGMGWLVRQGLISAERVLIGLPHPSGANAERIAYFLGRKERTLLSAKTAPDIIEVSRTRLFAQIAALPA
jgi:hypothetical protein